MSKQERKKRTRAERELAKLVRVTQQKVSGKQKQQEEEVQKVRHYDSTLLRDEKTVEESSAEEIFREMKRREF